MASKNLLQNTEMQALIKKAAELVLKCDAILFTSGAGMGVSSGLGTFRGVAAGVWPPLLKHPELDFTDMSNPQWFRMSEGNSAEHNTANFGYAFWAYRYKSYKSAAPHLGYEIAKTWSQLRNVKHSFSFTSNIDGHWIKSGWDESTVIECHGSIDYMQCVDNCSACIWKTTDELNLKVDPETDCAIDDLPKCPNCNGLARPNVLMFGDDGFLSGRHDQQQENYHKFMSSITGIDAKLLIIELGAGTAVPTVRIESENMFANKKWSAGFIRINPLEDHCQIPRGLKYDSNRQTIEIALDALTALHAINEHIKNLQND